jgi:hypothetical protein
MPGFNCCGKIIAPLAAAAIPDSNQRGPLRILCNILPIPINLDVINQ